MGNDKYLNECRRRAIKNVYKIYQKLDQIKELLAFKDAKEEASNAIEDLKIDVRRAFSEASRTIPMEEDKE